MKAKIGCVVVLLGAICIVCDCDVAAAENNSSLAPSTTTIGVCHLIPTPVVNSASAEYELGAVGAVATYLNRVEHIKVYQYLQSATTTETVLQQPKHGRLDADTGLYYPESGFFGKDSVTYLVEIGGHRVKVTFFIQVLGHSVGNENYYQGIGNESYNELCPTPRYWKISSTNDTSSNNAITSVEYHPT